MASPSKWQRRIERLSSMDRDELLDRLRQYVTARADWLRYGGVRQFPGDGAAANGRAEGHFFFSPADVPALCALLKKILPAEADATVLRAEKICHHRFDLLGFENLDYGVEIDWHLDVVHGKRAPRKAWFKINYLDFEEVGDSKITW